MAAKKPSRRASTPTVSELQQALANQTKRILDLQDKVAKLERKVPELAAQGAKEALRPKIPEELAAERRAARRNVEQKRNTVYGNADEIDPYAAAYREHLERITPEAIRRFAGGRQELVGHRLEIARQKLMTRYPDQYAYHEPKSQAEADLREHEKQRVEAERIRKEAEEAREREADLPSTQFVDPFGMKRWRSSGRRVLSDENALDRLREVERFNKEGEATGAMIHLEPETVAAAMRAEEAEAEAKRAPGRPKASAPENLEEELKQARERQARNDRRRAKAEAAKETEEPDITIEEHGRRRRERVAAAKAALT